MDATVGVYEQRAWKFACFGKDASVSGIMHGIADGNPRKSMSHVESLEVL